MILIDNNPHQEREVLLLSPICLEKALDSEEVQKILLATTQLERMAGTLNGKVDSHRSCQVSWLPYTDENAWIYGRLYDLAQYVNDAAYFFEPIDMVEPIMYCEYKEGDGFDWHYDMASHPPFSSRKLAITVQLSDSDDYRGGCLEFAISPDNTYTVGRGKGSVIIYPTYLMHQVQRVTSGTRKSLVFWVGGTSFT